MQDIDYQVYRCHFLDYGLHYFDEESTVFLILVSLWYAAFWSDPCIFGFSIFLGMSSWVFVLIYFSWFYWFVGWYFSSNWGNFQLLFLQVGFVFFFWFCSTLFPLFLALQLFIYWTAWYCPMGHWGSLLGFLKRLYFSLSLNLDCCYWTCLQVHTSFLL